MFTIYLPNICYDFFRPKALYPKPEWKRGPGRGLDACGTEAAARKHPQNEANPLYPGHTQEFSSNSGARGRLTGIVVGSAIRNEDARHQRNFHWPINLASSWFPQ